MSNFKPLSRNKWQWLAFALLIAGVSAGVGAGVAKIVAPSQPAFPFSLPVQASTAQNLENFSVATGPVDADIEAFYFLDFLTGDLRAAVINTRKGDFGAFFEYNIAQDFDLAGARNPKYLMVTGIADIPRGRGNTQIARSVVYITEATTGQMAAYVMPWNSSAQAAGKPQAGTFKRIGTVKLRNTFVRDQ